MLATAGRVPDGNALADLGVVRRWQPRLAAGCPVASLRRGTFLSSDIVADLPATQPLGTRPTDLPLDDRWLSSATHLLGSACCGTDSYDPTANG
jgi:hypothetical protein